MDLEGAVGKGGREEQKGEENGMATAGVKAIGVLTPRMYLFPCCWLISIGSVIFYPIWNSF